MKKTKLFTSIAALALVLGLGACETTSEEESTPEESEGTSQTTDTTTEGREEDLVFGFELEDGLVGIDGGTVVSNDKSYDYEGTYTANLDEAVKVSYAEGETTGEYYLSFELDGETRWITITEGNYTNLSYATEKAPLYYNPTYDCWGNEKQTHFLCYNAAYDCLYVSSITGTPKDSDVPYIETSPIAGLYYTDGSKVTGFVGDVYEEPELGYEIPEPNIGVDTTYCLGALIDEASYRFFNGATTGSTFLATTLDWDEAAEVYITAIPDDGVSNSCTLSLVVGEELKYISNNNSTSVTLADDPCIWVWVQSLGVFAQGSEDGRVLVYYANGQDFRGYTQNETNLAYPHLQAYSQTPEGYEPPAVYEIPEPKIGEDTTYKLGALDSNNHKYVYLDGGVSGNYLTTTETFDDGASFYITSVPEYSESNAVTLSYVDDGNSLKYLTCAGSTTLTYKDDPCIWVWVENEGDGYFAVESSTTGRFIALYDDDTARGYAQGSGNLTKYSHFVAYATAQENPVSSRTGSDFENVTSLESGKEYYIGGTNNSSLYLATGKVTSNYRLTGSSYLDDAAAFTVTGNNTDGYKLTLADGTYLYAYCSNSSHYFGFSSEATVPNSGTNLFFWDSTSATLYINGSTIGSTYTYAYFEMYSGNIALWGVSDTTSFSSAASFYQLVTVA